MTDTFTSLFVYLPDSYLCVGNTESENWTGKTLLTLQSWVWLFSVAAHRVFIVSESWLGESCSKPSNFSNPKHLHAASFALKLNLCFSVAHDCSLKLRFGKEGKSLAQSLW